MEGTQPRSMSLLSPLMCGTISCSQSDGRFMGWLGCSGPGKDIMRDSAYIRLVTQGCPDVGVRRAPGCTTPPRVRYLGRPVGVMPRIVGSTVRQIRGSPGLTMHLFTGPLSVKSEQPQVVWCVVNSAIDSIPGLSTFPA
jgi:hypothetical protein